MDLQNLNLETPDWGIMIPQLIVFGLAIALVFLDAFLPRQAQYKVLTAVTLGGFTAALISIWFQRDKIGGAPQSTFHDTLHIDGLSIFLSVVILVAAIFSVMISANYIQGIQGSRLPIGEYYVLLTFAVFGALLVASAGDMILIFIGLELSALATYILTAYTRQQVRSVEGALKYFLLGIFASAILLYGMAWTYGLSGATNLDSVRSQVALAVEGKEFPEAAVLLALLLLVVGLGFKIAAVPFHMWTPDAYEGAPTPVTGYMSVIPKAAGFAALIRVLVEGLEPLSKDWTLLLAILAVLTMALGNIVALSQKNLKRMLAYSSIAHTGYMLVGLAAYEHITAGVGGETEKFVGGGVTATLYYLLAYVFMNLGAFAVITWVQTRGRGPMLDDMAGLATQAPLPAAAMAIFMISLMGVPPLLGFYAKYYVIVAAMRSDLLWLAVTIVIMSGISAYFYLRVVATMYFSSSEEELKPANTPLLNIAIIVLVIANLALGLASSRIISFGGEWTNIFVSLTSRFPHLG